MIVTYLFLMNYYSNNSTVVLIKFDKKYWHSFIRVPTPFM